MVLIPSVFEEAAKLSNHRRINAMPRVQKISTGQPWREAWDDHLEPSGFLEQLGQAVLQRLGQLGERARRAWRDGSERGQERVDLQA